MGEEAGVGVRLVKGRGDNAHHIVESTFKAFARGVRAAMDAAEGIDVYAGAAASEETRRSAIQRSTKETSIDVKLDLDASRDDVEGSKIGTGIVALDGLFTAIQREAGGALNLPATGDLSIDDHLPPADASIAVCHAPYSPPEH